MKTTIRSHVFRGLFILASLAGSVLVVQAGHRWF
jgi:hypothetical protein